MKRALPRTFAELLAGPDDGRPLLVGADGDGDHGLTLSDLRRLAGAAAEAVPPGLGVALFRAPASPEAPLAGMLVALLAAGVPVYLPSTAGPNTAADLAAFRPWAVVSDTRVVPGFEDAADRTRRRLDRLAADAGVPHFDLLTALRRWGWPAAEAGSPAGSVPERPPRRDLVCLTTSGSTGEPRALRYAESSWMACVAAFDAAGLLEPDRLGGPTLCPGLCHSMGVRAVVLALWCRAPALFVQPEWLTAAPGEVARLLLAHPPRHITAGPALLGRLPALIETWPELRRVARGLSVAVSSGASFDPRLPERLPDTRLANAFGTTETQQISTTLLDPEAPLDTLGRPLPGVRWWLDDGALWVDSPFGADGPLGGPDAPRGQPTGDRVAVDADGRWRHAGRLDDHISTGVGVELARGPVEARYRGLPGVRRFVVAPHPDCPGLVGLAFVGDAAVDRGALAAALRARAEVHPPTAPFDADRLWAVGLVPGEPPLTGPGKLDRRAIAETHRDLLDALADPERAVGITLVDPLDPLDPEGPHPAWPERAPLTRALGLDVTVLGGVGDRLTVERAGQRFEVLDVVGGFGVNLLGHGDPELVDVARQALGAVPVCDQGTARPDEVALCRALADALAAHLDRPFAVALASTGAEAVDLALRHALLRRTAVLERHHAALEARFGARCPERLRALIADNRARAAATAPVLVTLHGGFHGTTLAARLVAGQAGRRALIAPLTVARTVELSRAVTAAERERLAGERLELRTLVDVDGAPAEARWRPSNLLAIFAEAVQGEGGVHPIDPEALDRLAAFDAPLIIDEIQAGLGRCGGLVADPRGVGEVYLFGKALGGGLSPISAVAIDRARLQPGFDAVRGSTFAGDGVGCRVARAVLARVTTTDVPGRAAAIGRTLGRALGELRRRWPTVIADVRGRGLLWGVELRRPSAPDPITAALAARGWGAVAASWLLHRRAVRALPTAGAPDVLRIEPSVAFSGAEVEALIDALDGLCAVLAAGDLAALIGPWVGAAPSPVTAAADERPSPVGATRVAFIHPLHAVGRALVRIAPALERLDRAARARLVDRLTGLMVGAPLPAYAHAVFGGRVLLDGIAVCVPSAAFTLAHRRGALEPVRAAVGAALRLARDRGATIAVLGGATSVVTDAGRAVLPPEGLRVVTGNSFTAAVVLDDVARVARARGVARSARYAVLGAAGNLGRALAWGLVDGGVAEVLTLVGRAGSRPALQALAASLVARGARVDVADDPRALSGADVVVAAVNSPRALEPHWLASDRPVMLFDASVPSIVPPHLARHRPRVHARRVGRARLPDDPRLRLAGVGRPGTMFACAAEGVLLALEPACVTGALVGPIDPAQVRALGDAGRRVGLLPSSLSRL